jgi:hypothetical protein
LRLWRLLFTLLLSLLCAYPRRYSASPCRRRQAPHRAARSRGCIPIPRPEQPPTKTLPQAPSPSSSPAVGCSTMDGPLWPPSGLVSDSPSTTAPRGTSSWMSASPPPLLHSPLADHPSPWSTVSGEFSSALKPKMIYLPHRRALGAAPDLPSPVVSRKQPGCRQCHHGRSDPLPRAGPHVREGWPILLGQLRFGPNIQYHFPFTFQFNLNDSNRIQTFRNS